MKHKDTKTQRNLFLAALCLCVFVFQINGCARRANAPTQPIVKSNRVVLYCSVDDVYARPIIRALEQQTGLKIDVLYDTEAAKTAGLANRIRAEKNRPQGDIFWSSALLQTLLLNREGLLQPYVSPSAKDIPNSLKAKDGLWTGLGVRARVVVFHAGKDALDWRKSPTSLEKLVAPIYAPVGISNPQFGSASDWAAALTVRWGIPKTLNFFRTLKKNHARILPGNSVVAEKVARGELAWGVTDLDDYLAARAKGALGLNFLNPTPTNTVLTPGSVAILNRAPHFSNARKLVDALLRPETENQLAKIMAGVQPIRGPVLPMPGNQNIVPWPGLPGNRAGIPDDTAQWSAAWDSIREPLAEILLKD